MEINSPSMIYYCIYIKLYFRKCRDVSKKSVGFVIMVLTGNVDKHARLVMNNKATCHSLTFMYTMSCKKKKIQENF